MGGSLRKSAVLGTEGGFLGFFQVENNGGTVIFLMEIIIQWKLGKKNWPSFSLICKWKIGEEFTVFYCCLCIIPSRPNALFLAQCLEKAAILKIFCLGED